MATLKALFETRRILLWHHLLEALKKIFNGARLPLVAGKIHQVY
jgi:hypothetical protein